ncbi:hypothetical protein A6302_02525 [Methylobrevis pamukkalensis]|uniref:Uncharacterized protein n=1 Tax=Methylobrevis pamukkalensis TaxID=1439726 RepID=A0A1E3H1X9_9HYPH|nr:hypothetical protein A6302_02525 [Methylobrevis pamukkalensis]
MSSPGASVAGAASALSEGSSLVGGSCGVSSAGSSPGDCAMSPGGEGVGAGAGKGAGAGCWPGAGAPASGIVPGTGTGIGPGRRVGPRLRRSGRRWRSATTGQAGDVARQVGRCGSRVRTLPATLPAAGGGGEDEPAFQKPDLGIEMPEPDVTRGAGRGRGDAGAEGPSGERDAAGGQHQPCQRQHGGRKGEPERPAPTPGIHGVPGPRPCHSRPSRAISPSRRAMSLSSLATSVAVSGPPACSSVSRSRAASRSRRRRSRSRRWSAT